MKLTRTYRKWSSMKARCYNPNHQAFRYYGGRGIKVCERWRNSFDAFQADMGEAPEGLWLDRIDNDKPYGPRNCRWVTPKASASNRRQRAPSPDSLASRAKAKGLTYHAVWQRLNHFGWTEEKALSVPPQRVGGMPDKLKRKLGLTTY